MAGEDAAHLAKLRAMPCARCLKPPPSEAHHRTGAGMALRAHDHEAMPLCTRCHRDLHARSGSFATMTRERLTTWQLQLVERLRARMLGDDEDVF